MKRIKFVGLDVHAETMAVAVAEQEGEVKLLGLIPNREGVDSGTGQLLRRKRPINRNFLQMRLWTLGFLPRFSRMYLYVEWNSFRRGCSALI